MVVFPRRARHGRGVERRGGSSCACRRSPATASCSRWSTAPSDEHARVARRVTAADRAGHPRCPAHHPGRSAGAPRGPARQRRGAPTAAFRGSLDHRRLRGSAPAARPTRPGSALGRELRHARTPLPPGTHRIRFVADAAPTDAPGGTAGLRRVRDRVHGRRHPPAAARRHPETLAVVRSVRHARRRPGLRSCGSASPQSESSASRWRSTRARVRSGRSARRRSSTTACR